jgi:hypothetical protein
MLRRYLLLGAICASLMLGLSSHSRITQPLWRLSFVPEAAAQKAPSANPVPEMRPAPGSPGERVTNTGDAAHSQK